MILNYLLIFSITWPQDLWPFCDFREKAGLHRYFAPWALMPGDFPDKGRNKNTGVRDHAIEFWKEIQAILRVGISPVKGQMYPRLQEP